MNTPQATPVNTRKAAVANTDPASKEAALKVVRDAVAAGQVSIRGLARETGMSPAWVSGKVKELRGDDGQRDAMESTREDEQVSA